MYEFNAIVIISLFYRFLKSKIENKQEGERNSGSDSQSEAKMENHSMLSRSIFEDFSSVNSNLTTPICWSKHVSLLETLIGDETSDTVAKWSYDQVHDFLTKFGIGTIQLDKFKEEVFMHILYIFAHTCNEMIKS